jgi:arylsulfatase A-like enzyme
VLVAALALCGGRALAAGARPNILLIVIETCRRDHVGCYGYRRDTTPALDRLASEGARFEQAVSASSWTIPSVMSIFTALPPGMHGCTTYQNSLPRGLKTIASELQASGYQTIGMTASPVTHSKFGFGRGFDLYDDFTVLMGAGVAIPEDAGALPAKAHDLRATSEQLTRMAAKWLGGRRAKDKPFFLFLFYLDPHYDYLPPPPYDRMFTDPGYAGGQNGSGIKELAGKPLTDEDKRNIVGLYDGELRYTDDHIGKLMEELRKQGLYDDTVILVTGDHGDEFWEHGGVGHGHTLYEELIRVPLIVRYPGLDARGTVVTGQVSHIDIMPTLMDMAGLPIPPQCLGRSLPPSLARRETGQSADRPVFLESGTSGELKAIRTPARKIVERGAGASCEMYALAEDPAEMKNLAGTSRAEEFSLLNGQFQQWRKLVEARAGERRAAKPVDLDPRLLQQLRSLGYVGGGEQGGSGHAAERKQP